MWTLRRVAIRFTAWVIELGIVIITLLVFISGNELSRRFGNGDNGLSILFAVAAFLAMCVVSAAFFCLVEIFENTRETVDLLKQIKNQSHLAQFPHSPQTPSGPVLPPTPPLPSWDSARSALSRRMWDGLKKDNPSGPATPSSPQTRTEIRPRHFIMGIGLVLAFLVAIVVIASFLPFPIQFFLAVIIVFGLIGATAWAFRRFRFAPSVPPTTDSVPQFEQEMRRLLQMRLEEKTHQATDQRDP
jgi:Na+/melibiose symporter-like transporter